MAGVPGAGALYGRVPIVDAGQASRNRAKQPHAPDGATASLARCLNTSGCIMMAQVTRRRAARSFRRARAAGGRADHPTGS